MSAAVETPEKNLHQRIRAVMKDIAYLQKDDSVGSGSYAYKAISIEKVMEVVRTSMIEHGLVILPVAQQHNLVDYERPGKNGPSIISLTTVDVQYKIVNVDKPDEFELLGSSGTGVDPQDKGVGKAMTYAHKNLALRLFMIPTGDDSDKVHNAEHERQQAAALKAAIEGATAKLDAATTQEQVKAVYKKDFLSDPLYKTALDKAVERVQQAAAPATEAVDSAVAANAGEAEPGTEHLLDEALALGKGPITQQQREEITRLLNNEVIKREEAVKGLAAMGGYTEAQADEKIDMLVSVIQTREAQPVEQ